MKTDDMPPGQAVCDECGEVGYIRGDGIGAFAFKTPAGTTVIRWLHRYPNCVGLWETKYHAWMNGSATGTDS